MTDWLTYSNTGATRNQPLSPQLVDALSFLGDMGVTANVFSGGQPHAGGGPRVGSTRHDAGMSGDVTFMKDGRVLDWNNPQDIPIFQEIVRRGKERGITGFGAGPGYMSEGSMHIGFGAPAVWGAGGKSANAPDWLREAYGVPASGGYTTTISSKGGAKPMGLLDMQDEPQTFAERLKSQWQSGELKDRIALAANTLRMNPDQNLAAALQGRQQAREERATINKTAQWLALQGREDLAQAMLTGGLDAKSAVAVAMQPADPLAAINLEKARLELEQLRNPQPDASNVVVVDGKLVDKMTGQIVYAGTPETPDPQSAIAKLEADLRAGLISQEQYQAALAAMAPQGMSIETGPDGQLRIVQGAGAGMGKPFTEAQSKDVVYSTRAQGALEVLEPVAGSLTSLQSRAAEFDPTGYVRGAVQSPEYQVAKNAGDEFLQAILRKDTGAGITAQEQELYGKTYLPQPGDGPQVLEAKKAARQRAVAAINAGMSPQQMVAAERANGATTGAPAAGGPSDDDLLRMYGVGQ